jgi:hypothetical protein
MHEQTCKFNHLERRGHSRREQTGRNEASTRTDRTGEGLSSIGSRRKGSGVRIIQVLRSAS